jgi:hypothetical protein
MTLDVRSLKRLLLPLLAALALAAGLVACGGDDSSASDKKDYINQVNAAQKKFAAGVAKLDFANPSSIADLRKSVAGLDPLLSGIVRDLEGIDPPDEVEDEHDKLVRALRDYQSAVNKSAEGIASGDQAAAREFSTASTKFSTEFDQTVNAINKKLRE